jgi:cell wall-associated NlpC family hydrolase
MTPPSRTKNPARRPHSFLIALSLLLGAAALPSAANAMLTPQALPSLAGLSPAPQHKKALNLRDRVVEAGLDAIGTPYSWGGDDPDDGFDCSGLVSFVYREVAGVELPRRARDQNNLGKKVQQAQLLPGDLVFFKTGRGRRAAISHVGIYVGKNEFVHAPTRGSSVRVDKMDSTYWAKHFTSARRFISPDAGGNALVALRSGKSG